VACDSFRGEDNSELSSLYEPNLALRIAVAPLLVAQQSDEPEQLSDLFRTVLRGLPYYNERAKASESAKYTADRLRQSASSDRGSVLVAHVDGKLGGFIISNLDDETIWLSWFGVDAAFRERGVGSALLLALDSRARSLGAHKIWCDSRTENLESKIALNKHGFQQICTIPDHWYRQDFILWEKRVG
jgi:ribosomal protein S18 acetylase RimI-like enzyme